jgi:hypothetical protein
MYLKGGEGPLFQTTIGYGDPSNTIGDEVWFGQAGIYDVSTDSSFSGFLIPATNGTWDAFYFTLSDQYGHAASMYLDTMYIELSWLGHYPDLAPLEITGARLAVETIFPSFQGTGVGVHWEFLGVPEPGSLILLAAGLLLTRHPRRQAAGNLKQG